MYRIRGYIGLQRHLKELQRIQSSLGELWNKSQLITVQGKKYNCNISCIRAHGVLKQMLMVVLTL